MTSKNILIVEDPKDQDQSCYKELENDGFSITVLNSVEDALKCENNQQLIILDLKLNNEGDINLIEQFKTKTLPSFFAQNGEKIK